MPHHLAGITLYRYAVPLRTILTFGDQQLTRREGLLIQLKDQQGRYRLGDIAPLPGFSRESLSECEIELRSYLQGECQALSLPSVQFGWDCAQHPLPAATSSQPDYPLLQGNDVIQRWQQWPGAHPAIVKLKVARQHVDEEIRLCQKLLSISPNTLLRLDANQGWSLSTAKHFVTAIGTQHIDYIEEPCPTLIETQQLHADTHVKFALDEHTQVPGYQCQSLPGLSALVLKPTLIGAFDRCHTLIRQAHALGVQATLSASFESQIGIQHLARLANRWTPHSPPGLDTLRYLSQHDFSSLTQPTPAPSPQYLEKLCTFPLR